MGERATENRFILPSAAGGISLCSDDHQHNPLGTLLGSICFLQSGVDKFALVKNVGSVASPHPELHVGEFNKC